MMRDVTCFVPYFKEKLERGRMAKWHLQVSVRLKRRYKHLTGSWQLEINSPLCACIHFILDFTFLGSSNTNNYSCKKKKKRQKSYQHCYRCRKHPGSFILTVTYGQFRAFMIMWSPKVTFMCKVCMKKLWIAILHAGVTRPGYREHYSEGLRLNKEPGVLCCVPRVSCIQLLLYFASWKAW